MICMRTAKSCFIALGTLAAMASAALSAQAAECRKGEGAYSQSMSVCGCPTIAEGESRDARWLVKAPRYTCNAAKSEWEEAGMCVDLGFKSLESAIDVVRALAASNSQTCY